MIYAMPGMETQLHAVMNKTGTYRGSFRRITAAMVSPGMHFPSASLSAADFDKWVAKVKADGGALDRNTYLDLERPSENVPPRDVRHRRRQPLQARRSINASSPARCASTK